MVVNLGPDFVKVWVGGLANHGAPPPVVSLRGDHLRYLIIIIIIMRYLMENVI